MMGVLKMKGSGTGETNGGMGQVGWVFGLGTVSFRVYRFGRATVPYGNAV